MNKIILLASSVTAADCGAQLTARRDRLTGSGLAKQTNLPSRGGTTEARRETT